MLEHNSLFAKIKIKKENFDNFLSSKPVQPALNENWSQWWNSRNRYQKVKLSKTDIYSLSNKTNADIINCLLNVRECQSFSDYDQKNETWHFGIITFAQDYSEMIPGLAFIKSISKYKDTSSNDFAIVYPFCQGYLNVDAFINYVGNESHFDPKILNTTDVKPAILEYSEEYLNKKLEQFERAELINI